MTCDKLFKRLFVYPKVWNWIYLLKLLKFTSLALSFTCPFINSCILIVEFKFASFKLSSLFEDYSPKKNSNFRCTSNYWELFLNWFWNCNWWWKQLIPINETIDPQNCSLLNSIQNIHAASLQSNNKCCMLLFAVLFLLSVAWLNFEFSVALLFFFLSYNLCRWMDTVGVQFV